MMRFHSVYGRLVNIFVRTYTIPSLPSGQSLFVPSVMLPSSLVHRGCSNDSECAPRPPEPPLSRPSHPGVTPSLWPAAQRFRRGPPDTHSGAPSSPSSGPDLPVESGLRVLTDPVCPPSSGLGAAHFCHRQASVYTALSGWNAFLPAAHTL